MDKSTKSAPKTKANTKTNTNAKTKAKSAKQPIRRRVRRGGRVKSLRDGLRPLAQRIFRNRGLGDGALVLHWAEVVGPELSACCAPVKIAFPRGEAGSVSGKAGTLHLTVEAGAATLVQHRQPEILPKVNGFLGFRAVDRIALSPAPLGPQPRIQPKVRKPIRDDEEPEIPSTSPTNGQTGHQRLDQALARLGRGIVAKERQKT